MTELPSYASLSASISGWRHWFIPPAAGTAVYWRHLAKFLPRNCSSQPMGSLAIFSHVKTTLKTSSIQSPWNWLKLYCYCFLLWLLPLFNFASFTPLYVWFLRVFLSKLLAPKSLSQDLSLGEPNHQRVFLLLLEANFTYTTRIHFSRIKALNVKF